MQPIERRRTAWVVSLALMVTGGLVAHTLAYELAAAESHAAHSSAHPDVHSYLAVWPICAATCGTIILVSLIASVLVRTCASRPVSAPLWLFALLPPIGFAVQEHAERLLATGEFPQSAALEPTFALGLILQIPFALAAYLAARVLIALAVAVARRLRGEPHRRRGASEPAGPRPMWISVVPISALSLGNGERAPPFAAL
jgi:hypothetical protein